ncbi:MAG: L,D-transpeptidase family protein [Myxococcota bacterium]
MKNDTGAAGKASPVAMAGAAGLGLGIGIAAFMLLGSRAPAAPAGTAAGGPAKPVAAQHATATPEAAKPGPAAPVPPVVAAAPGEGAADAAPGGVAPNAEAAPEAPPDPGRVAAIDGVIAQLATAHASLHAKAESGDVDKARDDALEATFGKDKADKRFAKELYAAYGPGRFVRGGHLTSLGEAVLARAHAVEAHGISATPYALDELDGIFATVAKSSDAGAANSGPTYAVMLGALEATSFDRDGVRERLLALAEPLDDGLVARAIAAASSRSDSGPTANDLPLDARLMKTFIDLVFDFRFIKKAGPFWLKDRGDVYEKGKKDLNAFVAQVMGADSASQAMALFDPPHPQYARMLEVYAMYQGFVASKACEKLPDPWRFRKGSKGKEVEKLQHRLACEGYYGGPFDGIYDGPTTEAVKAFQRHHDLDESGQVLDDTMEALNVSMEFRVRQIALALQHMREAHFERMGDFFLRVNLPSYLMRAYEHGKVVLEHRVIIGTNKLDDDKVELVQGHINRTKLFATRLYQVIVNPTWILPKRVEAGELQTNIDKDPDHLAKSNIKKVKLGSGTEVFVQGAGKGNVLGKVKFLLEESNAIYLHDTDKRQLFKKRDRAFSHGCMRVHEAMDFARWILAREGVAKEDVEHALSSSVQRAFDLKSPINLVTEYLTVDLADDGFPMFFPDVYGYDAAYWNDKLPPSERTRWGDAILRPRWVPVMEGATVDAWRKEGKAAPRDLGPDGKPLKKAPPPDADTKEP